MLLVVLLRLDTSSLEQASRTNEHVSGERETSKVKVLAQEADCAAPTRTHAHTHMRTHAGIQANGESDGERESESERDTQASRQAGRQSSKHTNRAHDKATVAA